MKKWIFREEPKERPPIHWAEDLSITPLFLEILWRRGLRSCTAIDAYLSSRLGNLTPPAQWPQIPQAAQIIVSALLAGQRMAVWGDYDVDGVTATAVVLEVLAAHGITPMYHLPDRLTEGYGLNIAGIEELAKAGCNLLLTVDSGISNAEAIAFARKQGMTVVITDHHLPPAELPDADAIVNPRITHAGAWPCAHLAGVGVAFYLMGAVNSLLSPHTGQRYRMDEALDLVALGTMGDVMLLEGENRILVRGGLAQMAGRCRPGIGALKVIGGMDLAGELSCGQALFRLVPRINAAGRMADASLALRLLRARDYSTAEALAQELDDCNTQRKAEEKRIYEEAAEQAREYLQDRPYSGLVLYGADWHPGIVGIVASRIVEAFRLPTIILCGAGETVKGSGRSIDDFDLHGGLEKASRFLTSFGGHRLAAGVRLQEENIAHFREDFHRACQGVLGTTPPAPSLLVECELDFRTATNSDFLKELQLMQPFGPGNIEPIFVSPPLLVKERNYIGRSQEHVVLTVADETSHITIGAKAWRMGQQIPTQIKGRHIQLAYTPRLDYYRGMPVIDLEVKDWRLLSY